MPWPLVLFLLFLFAALAGLWFVRLLWRERQQRKEIQRQFELTRPGLFSQASYEFLKLENQSFPETKKASYLRQSKQWRDKMLEAGQKFSRQRVSQIVLVHGTFVGNDPFGLFQWIGDMLGEESSALAKKVMDQLYEHQSSLYRDVGYFGDEYAELLQKGLGSEVNVDRFIWTSGNHHAARLQAAVRLSDHLIELSKTSNRKQSRICLWGHSHAGQIFALFLRLLKDKATREEVADLYPPLSESALASKKLRKRLCELGLSFVCFGTPPRYQWIGHHYGLLHLINHRGDRPIGGTLSGFLTTRDGDYIQQWGIDGSDAWSPFSSEQTLNKKLDRLLGVGRDPRHWLELIKKRQRLPSKGHALLIDYGDSGLLPNFWRSFFGHAVYTETELMAFHAQCIADFFSKNEKG